MTTPRETPGACNVSAWSNADLLSSYVELTGRLRDHDMRMRCALDCRAGVRDAIIERLGLAVAVRFMAHVERTMPK